MGRRFLQVGGLSLATLFSGGVILILFSVNVLISKRDNTYKLTDACSYRSTRSPGLNYARYLNSQPNAPVLIGFRGFKFWVVCRHVVTALGITASITYKFAVVKLSAEALQHLDESSIRLHIPPVKAVLEDGTASPWLSDGPSLGTSHAFLHQKDSLLEQNEILPQPPARIVMVGWADCNDTFNFLDSGILYTREIVIVAHKSEDNTAGETTMTLDQADWLRVEDSNSRWLNTSSGVVVDYRVSKPGSVEIRWAERGDWLHDSSQQQKVARKLTYDMHFAVTVVRRFVSNGGCSRLSDRDGGLLAARFVVNSRIPVHTGNDRDPLVRNHNWINAFIVDNPSIAGPISSVSGLIRNVMAGWGTQLWEQNASLRLGHVPKDPLSWQFSGEDNNASAFYNASSFLWDGPQFPTSDYHGLDLFAMENKVLLEYPVFSGIRATTQTGSYLKAAFVFLLLGLFAFVIVVVRVLLGPAELTSWTGQHVCIALSGKLPKDGAEHMASGFRAACRSELGLLRIKANEPLNMYTPTTAAWSHWGADSVPTAYLVNR
ncbi:hypothetical protein B0H66DRAFT_611269 [Apodospora peruviana]|uniref:Uncharacterized protein n=1 Tax=Apodospora peruviana TaxID=516989 RepID=A0AAE0IRP0_9PEZI|nr:hypothetical protein B0H66DRAFT_611269 [Apodospora peruviana]